MLAWRDVDIPLNPQEGHRGYQIVRPVGKAGNNPQHSPTRAIWSTANRAQAGQDRRAPPTLLMSAPG